MTIAIVSGYFDPLHVGHLDLIRRAKSYGKVFVIVNNNEQAIQKKGKYFMDEIERAKIISENENVYSLMISIDKDKTVNRSIRLVRALNPETTIYFINGDEYSSKNCAEHKTCKELDIITKYGEGKKIQSSSWLTNKK